MSRSREQPSEWSPPNKARLVRVQLEKGSGLEFCLFRTQLHRSVDLGVEPSIRFHPRLPFRRNGAQLRLRLVLRLRRFAPTLSMSGGFLRFS
jgi:hypothetical protein